MRAEHVGPLASQGLEGLGAWDASIKGRSAWRLHCDVRLWHREVVDPKLSQDECLCIRHLLQSKVLADFMSNSSINQPLPWNLGWYVINSCH